MLKNKLFGVYKKHCKKKYFMLLYFYGKDF